MHSELLGGYRFCEYQASTGQCTISEEVVSCAGAPPTAPAASPTPPSPPPPPTAPPSPATPPFSDPAECTIIEGRTDLKTIDPGPKFKERGPPWHRQKLWCYMFGRFNELKKYGTCTDFYTYLVERDTLMDSNEHLSFQENPEIKCPRHMCHSRTAWGIGGEMRNGISR